MKNSAHLTHTPIDEAHESLTYLSILYSTMNTQQYLDSLRHMVLKMATLKMTSSLLQVD